MDLGSLPTGSAYPIQGLLDPPLLVQYTNTNWFMADLGV